MKALLILSAAVLAVAAPAHAEDSAEAAFVACLAEKDPAMIAAIRDADSQEAFVEAVKKGADLCETDLDGFSMGKLFTALNAYKTSETEATESDA